MENPNQKCIVCLGLGMIDKQCPYCGSSPPNAVSLPFQKIVYDVIDRLMSLSDKCPKCEWTFSDIQKHQRIGCDFCYNFHLEKLKPYILKHQNNFFFHTGKIPKTLIKIKEEERIKHQEERFAEIDRISLLEQDLLSAIREEKYEMAAILRDTLKNVKKKTN